jgi:hypothetical protein
MKKLTLAGKDSSFNIPPQLDVATMADREVVRIGCTPIANFVTSDITTRRHVMVQLAEAGGIKGIEVARAFNVTPIYVSLLRSRYRNHGASALSAARRGPKGPMKVTPRLEARVRKLRSRGMSYHDIARDVSKRKKISYQTVRRILLTEPLEQQDLLPMSQTVEEPALPPLEAAAQDLVFEQLPQGETRYAGAMLLHVALGLLGLWSVFAKLGAQLGRTKLQVKQVVGIVALGFALRLRSIEGFKTALRRDFGMLLGLPVVPGVQTLRTHVAALAESVEPDLVMKKLLEAFVQLEPVWEGAYYIDGHFCPYSGSRPLAKGWNAKRRLVEPGQTDVYVHDAAGRALFFINRPLNDHLSKVLPKILEEIRSVAGEEKILLIFDRGGYSGTLFEELTKLGIGFITYLKGRKAKRRFPSAMFERRWWEVTDPAGINKTKRYVYRIYEKGTRLRGPGVMRTLILEDQEGQIPVLTNCKKIPSAKTVHLLKMRWRQENSFKYLSEHYGVEQLIQYGVTYDRDDRLVNNPLRARLRKERNQLLQEVLFKEAQLGQALEFNNEKTRKTARGIKLAHSGLRKEINELHQRIDRLESRLAHTPAKVRLEELAGKNLYRATMKTDRRNLVNVVKLATYNAERLLARCFFKHYGDPRDWLTMFRSILHLPGSISHQSDGCVHVDLKGPDRPKVREALRAMLAELNEMNSRFLGSEHKLIFTVRD